MNTPSNQAIDEALAAIGARLSPLDHMFLGMYRPILVINLSREGMQDVVLDPDCYSDPGVWGVVLSDVVGHLANSYAQQGMDPTHVRRNILDILRKESESPTDKPRMVGTLNPDGSLT